MKKFDAIILSGGKGNRVKKFTKKIPKCLIDINGKPFLYHQLKNLKNNNINNVILSVGYLGNQIRSYVLHPYKLIKDLRTNHESSNVNNVLDGNIDTFLEKSLTL